MDASIVNNALVSIINDVASAKNFILSQAPDVISQLIQWNTIKYGSLVLFLGVLALFMYICGIYLHKKYLSEPDGDRRDDEDLAIGAGAAYIVGIAISVFVVWNIFALVKIYVAPKVWLIEYAARLV